MKSYNPFLFPFQSKWIDINSNKIHYIDEGQGELILFFHPPIASSFMYRHMIKILRSHYRCIALDFPGFGLSSAAEGFQPSIQSFSTIVEVFIITLRLNNFYIVVQEVGGHAALLAILKQPAILKGIILTDTIIFPVSQYPKLLKMLNIVNSSVFNFVNSNFNLLIKISVKSGFAPRKLSREEKETYYEMFDTKEKRVRTTKLLHELAVQEVLLSKIQNAFETVFNNTPTLLIYGENDSLNKLGIPLRIKAMMKNAELHIMKGVEHFPHEGLPEELCNLIKNWISG